MQLKGHGFVIRCWKRGDEASLQRNANNPNISGFLLDRFPAPYTMEVAQAWVDRWKQQDPLINFAIAINAEVVGGIGLELREDVYRKTVLLGYWISEDLWGKGMMTEAVKLITDYAFANLDIIRIQAGVLSNNPASMRVLKRPATKKKAYCATLLSKMARYWMSISMRY